MPIIFSTVAPASQACPPPARVYFEAPDDALLARVTEKVAELMGRHLSYTFHDEAPGGVTPIILEDVGPSALPVPSAAVALSDDLRDGLVAISKAVADQDDRAAQAMLKEILAAPKPSSTPQADSQPARDYLPLPDFDAVEQHIYGACRRYIAQDMLEPIHNLIRDAIDADRAQAAGR